MSRSGVLFHAQDGLKPEEDVEMVFVLPVSAEVEGAVVLTCQGRVVRAMEATLEAPTRMAAMFETYQFLRPAAAEEA
jgi:hypothetical protein